jgi:anti-sigma28 factor (negative regulator of flagellin synthesis)
MVNALNSGIVGLKNKAMEMDGVKLEKKQNLPEVSKQEESKVEKLKKSIEGGEYQLDMEKTAKALVGF